MPHRSKAAASPDLAKEHQEPPHPFNQDAISKQERERENCSHRLDWIQKRNSCSYADATASAARCVREDSGGGVCQLGFWRFQWGASEEWRFAQPASFTVRQPPLHRRRTNGTRGAAENISRVFLLVGRE